MSNEVYLPIVRMLTTQRLPLGHEHLTIPPLPVHIVAASPWHRAASRPRLALTHTLLLMELH